MFNSKVFCAGAKFSVAELSGVRYHPREELDAYVKRFHERAFNYFHLVEERMLVDVCLLGMMEEYRIFLENLSFYSFSKLMELARHTNEQYYPVLPVDLARTPHHERGPLLQPSRKENAPDYWNKKKSTQDRREPTEFPTLPPFPYDPKKVATLLDKWVKGRDIPLPEVRRLLTRKDQEW